MSARGRHFAAQESIVDELIDDAIDTAIDEVYEDELKIRHMPAWLDFLATIATALVLAALIRIFIAQTYKVPSGSMLETIQLNDRLVGEKVTLHWSEPVAGDIVTFDDPKGSGETLIKRVIATEGQVIDLQGGHVIVDGVELDEPYTLGKPTEPINVRDEGQEDYISYPLTVPEGCIWVMGDNRVNSLDSRYFGPVSLGSVTSKALFIYWPPSDIKAL